MSQRAKHAPQSVTRKNLADLQLSSSGRAQFKLSTKSASLLFLSSSTEQVDADQLLETMVWTWGSGKYGRLGIGSTVDASVPTPVVDFAGRTVIQVDCGSFVSAYITDDGQLWMSGKDIHGLFAGQTDEANQRLKDDYLSPIALANVTHVVRVAVGERICAAVTEFGDLLWWGGASGAVHRASTEPELKRAFPKVAQVACGLEHAMALSTTGTVYSWGSNVQRQLGHGVPGQHYLVPEPVVLPHGPHVVVSIACSDNSSALLTASGAVYACGSVVGQQDMQAIPALAAASDTIAKVFCNDTYLACVDLLGNAYLWHQGAVPFLDAKKPEAAQPVVRLFPDYSVRGLLCGSDWIACVTDGGAIHAWGRSSLQLGIGEVRAKKHVVGPKLLGTFSARFVRSASCGPNHVGALVLAPSSTRELLGWELLETERIYMRSLQIVLKVYRAQAKPRSKLAKLLTEIEALMAPHTQVLRQLDAIMATFNDATVLGPVFEHLSSKRFIESYTRFQRAHSEWSRKATSQFAPGGKMFAEGEALVPEALRIRKTDSPLERKKPIHLVGLLNEPMERVRQYFWLCSRLRALTPDWHADKGAIGASTEAFQRELSGYYTEHEMLSMTIARLEGDNAELLKKLTILSATNDNLFLSRNNHEMQKRDLTDVLEQHEHKIRTMSRETDQLKERLLEQFLDKRRETLRKRRAEAAAKRAAEEAAVFKHDARRLQVELEATRSLKLYRELVEQKRLTSERDMRIVDLTRQLAAAQEAQLEQRYTAMHVTNVERENERLAKELEAARARVVELIRNQHAPLDTALQEAPGPGIDEGPFFASDGSVRGASVSQLVALLVSLEDKAFLQPYLRAFFLMYRVFITPTELAYALQELYCAVPKHCDPPTQWSRVLGVLRYWITEHVDDFKSVPGMRTLLWGFLEETVCVTLSPSTADAIMKDFTRQLLGDERLAKEQHAARLRLTVTNPVPLDMSVVCDKNAPDIAAQLMLIEHELLALIQPKELLGCGWLKGASQVRRPPAHI